jgi:hypothetical protein
MSRVKKVISIGQHYVENFQAPCNPVLESFQNTGSCILIYATFYFILFFGSTEVLISHLAFALQAVYHLSHIPILFALVIFQ